MKLNVIYVIAAILLAAITIVPSMVTQHLAYNNCIKYHEHLSVVDANKTCDKIVLGETK